MPREIPDCPSDKPNPPRSLSRSYEIELITPMVGGGAVAGEVDSTFPIRPTAIRGQLRHWWRLVRGHSLGAGMWQREEEVFGSTEFPSPVSVSVKPGAKRPELYPTRGIKPTSTHGYVLFPSIEKEQALLTEGYQFHLEVTTCTADDLQKRRASQNRKRKPAEPLPPTIEPITNDVNFALAAWLLFGGIGARTRRGCGALRVVTESEPWLISTPPKDLLKQVLQGTSDDFKVFQPPSPMPHLRAWETVIDLLKRFRQPGPARRGEPRRKFPEAETLRRMTGVRGHRNRPISEKDLPSGFPRAELGLPIVFQFKDGSGPDGITALPHGMDGSGKPLQRMSSPVILKPIPVSQTHSLPTIVVVRCPLGLTVDVAAITKQPVTDPKFASYPNSPLADPSSGSAIQSFVKFSGYEEVTR